MMQKSVDETADDKTICIKPKGWTRWTRRNTYDAFMLFLSLYVLVVLALEIVTDWSEKTSRIFESIDLLVCLVFLSDWTYFFVKAKNKWLYSRSRFFDLLSSIPFAQTLRFLRVFRAVRLARALRLVRGLKGLFPLLRFVTKNKNRSTISIYLSCTLIIYFYCALGLLNFEKGTNESITTYGDALWCAFTTLTTVGYGDIFPKTTGGRIMSAMLVLTGMGLFSMMTAEFATLFLTFMREEKANRN